MFQDTEQATEHVYDQAFISLATNNQYATGALVLGQSLRRVNTRRKLALLVTDGVTQPLRNQLKQIWDTLISVASLDSNDTENLALLARPELGITFTKLKVWTLTQFKKCVFLDADTLVIQNVDELFEREELSAAPDIGWPDCFNSGVFVFEPSMVTYGGLLKHATDTGSFDGGDQGLLNTYFKDWATKDISYHLPFLYNMVANVCYTYAPAYKQYGKDVKIVHFLGAVKPWHQNFDKSTGRVTFISSGKANQCDERLVQLWWDTSNEINETDRNETSKKGDGVESIDPVERFQPEVVPQTVAEAPQQNEAYQRERQSDWEQGKIDYTGADRFSRIRRHLDNKINGN